jgi:hypothetical protein
MRHSIDEMIFHRIGQRIHHGAPHIVRCNQFHNRGATTTPKVIVATPQAILTTRSERMQIMSELGNASIGVENHRVMMIGHRARRKQPDIGTLRCADDIVQIRIVGFFIGPKKKRTVEASSHDGVKTTRYYLAR